jgi:predicted small metal-binding protein
MPDKKLHTEVPATGSNPNIQSSDGGINPSAPSAGTAGWGSAPDEKRKQIGQNNPKASSADAKGAGDVRYTSYPQNEAAQNPAAQEHTHGDRSFRCSDDDCDWTVTGNSEDEILGYMRSHAREVHGKNEFTPKELSDARHAIHKHAA